MPRFAIAPTDLEWFEQLRSLPSLGSVNFWTPTPWSVRGLNAGDRLYFMLKSPIRKVGGFGIFSRYTDMTASDAWQAYGLGNGVETKQELIAKIEHFAEKRSVSFQASDNPLIGCIELSDAVFLDDAAFIVPEDYGHSFPNQVVKLKYFDEPDNIAPRIGAETALQQFSLISGESDRVMASRKARRGQSVFRQAVLASYGHKCCITGETVPELLEAAHIQPYIDERSNHVQNGLSLRVDLHRLFDAGLITVSEDLKVRLHESLMRTSYAALEGQDLRAPLIDGQRPSSIALAFHRGSKFRA
jgi:putative restriction endonuclease